MMWSLPLSQVANGATPPKSRANSCGGAGYVQYPLYTVHERRTDFTWYVRQDHMKTHGLS